MQVKPLATNLVAEWERLARMLEIGENKVAIYMLLVIKTL